jgi:fumarylacetoacetate (FAA) hydrolase
MKLISYERNYEERAGIFYENNIYDIQDNAFSIKEDCPSTIGLILKGEDALMAVVKDVFEEVKKGNAKPEIDEETIKLLAPVPRPVSCRDGYAFRQHVATARSNRGLDMIPEFDKFPVFYFTNHNAIFGPGEVIVEEDHLNKLDFELEAAIVIGRRGKNIPAHEADEYIAGYMIMNDLSARYLQMEEMKLNLGPAKGKDFATVIGPYLVTPDELEQYKSASSHGNKYNLKMSAYHNGIQVSEGNMNDMNWTFAEINERASYGVELLPGDVIGSGTVGTGCYLELNGTWALQAKDKGDEFTPVWLKEGDTIELEIEGLGKLSNKITKAEKEYSIFTKEAEAGK